MKTSGNYDGNHEYFHFEDVMDAHRKEYSEQAYIQRDDQPFLHADIVEKITPTPRYDVPKREKTK